MHSSRSVRSYLILLAALLVLSSVAGCAGRLFGAPPGKRIASCQGAMHETTGDVRAFRIDLFASDESDLKAYFSLPGRGARYLAISDISFEDGIVSVETVSPSHTYRGEIVPGKLIFKGWWQDWSGLITLKGDR